MEKKIKLFDQKELGEITECETNGNAREKITRFVFQIRQFKEFDLAKMQSYLTQLYVIEQNPKISETIADINTLIKYVRQYLYEK